MLFGISSSGVTAEGVTPDYGTALKYGTDNPKYSDGESITIDGTTYSGQDFRSWLQYDSRWSGVKLGSSETIGHVGCTVTSITKLIIEAGLASPTELNPGILVKYLNANDGFAGNVLVWDKVSEFCSNVLGKEFKPSYACFKGEYNADSNSANRDTLTIGTDVTYDEMIDWINEGYHMVLQVNKNAGHWIAVDEWETLSRNDGKVYVMDSWRNTSARHALTLDEYLTADFGSLYGYPSDAVKFSRIAAYKTALSDTDNANYKQYDTDFIGYQDYNYTYRNWSRYDSRWATTELDVPDANARAEYVGQWGQALLALTKTLIEAGAIDESSTPNDVLSSLRNKGLITTDGGVISWGSLDGFDNVISATAGSASTTITAATIRENIRSGKHHILRVKSNGSEDMAWLAVDEQRIMASTSGDIPVLDSGKSLDENAGNQTSNGSLYRLHTFNTSTTPTYYQLSYSGSNASNLKASYTLGSETITVDNGGYVPAGTVVTLTAVPDSGYSGIGWSSTGSTGTANGRSYTVTVNENTTVNASGVAGTYNIIYTTQTDSCGFRYGTNPSTAAYGSSATFTVTPATSGYTVTVSSDDVALTNNGDNTYTIASMPAKDVHINVTSTFNTYTVYLDAESSSTNYTNGADWYVYTWTGNSGDEYDCQWIKANPDKTASGYYQFDNVRSRVIFVRVKKDAEFDTTKTLGEVIADYTGDNQVVYNQSKDEVAGAEALYTITAWQIGDNSVDHDKLKMDAQFSFVYLYPRALEVREGVTDYDILNQYEAWTWSGSEEGSFAAKSIDENGILRFYGLKDKVQFFRFNPAQTTAHTTSSNWGHTADINLNDPNVKTGDMFVVNKFDNGNMVGYWANYDDVTGTDYRKWTKNDPRWSEVTLGDSTDAGDLIGNFTQAQAFTKLILQAGFHPEWDVADIGASKTYTPSGNINFESTNYKAWGFTDRPVNETGTYESANLSTSIYDYLIKGQHVVLRCYNGTASNGEWVVVDEERTLSSYGVNGGTDIYVLRTTDNPTECVGTKLTDVDSRVRRIVVFEGGTTPLLTRNYDYRTWSRYDGRWESNAVGEGTSGSGNPRIMRYNGACIIAISKMFVQAGILSDDYNGNGVYDDGTFDRTAKTGDYTPEALRSYLASLGVADNSNTAGLMKDGSVYWAKVNGFVNNTLEFATTDTAYGYIYLKFDEPIDGVVGYGKKVDKYAPAKNETESYLCSKEEATLFKALLQGYHMLIEVPSKNSSGGEVTWVTVDEKKSLETGRIYVMDSEKSIAFNADTTLVDDYQYFYRVVGYKGATVPLPTEYTTPDGETLISPHLEPSVYYDIETAENGKDDCYRILYNSGSYLTVQVGGAVIGKSYVMTVDGQTYEVPSTADNTKNGILTYTFDGTSDYVTNHTTIPLNDNVTNTELTKELSVKCKYEKDGTITYSNTVTGTMYYKMYAVYEFKYRPRRGGEEITSSIRVPCEYEFLDNNSPTADPEIIAAHIPTNDDVRIYKELIDWGKAGISTEQFITTINTKEPVDEAEPAQYPDLFTLTYYYYDENGLLTQSGTVKDVAYNTQTVDLRDTGVLDYKPEGTADDAVFLGWYEATLENDELVIGDRCLSTLERFGMVITRNTMIAPKFGDKTISSDWSAYIDENTVTVEKSDDPNGGHMFADFLVRYLNAGGTEVIVPDDATYGVLFVYSADDLADTSAKSAATLKAYATHSGLLGGAVGNTNDGNGHSMKVANAKASSLSELNRVSIAVQNSYNNFRGCHYTAYAYITYTDSLTGAKVTSLSSPVTGSFPN